MTSREKLYWAALKDINELTHRLRDLRDHDAEIVDDIKHILNHVLQKTNSPKWPENLQRYENARYQQFVMDIVEAMENGVFDESERWPKFQHYEGRFFYEGPAVSCTNAQLETVIRCTDVSLRKDNLGFDWIVYPG